MTDVGVRPMLGGRYELGRVIGVGGMARVHCGTDTVLGRTVAVKVFRLDADPTQIGRIENESRALAAVQHPGLVSVYDAGTWTREDGVQVPFLVMEFVDGPTLAECCADGSLDVEQVVEIGADLAEALAHVHDRGIVHRDVKPANILLSAERRPKLTDFGIARLVDSARHTQTGMLVGTAAYLSPEQVQGRDVGPATDIFALGLVLLEAVTGRREYQGNSVETALARLERLPAVPDDLPVPLRRLLARMTAAEPENRPTATQVAESLRADMTAEVRATAALTSQLPAAPAASLDVAAPVEQAAPLDRDGARPEQQRGDSAFPAAARAAARRPWFLVGVLVLIATVAVVIALVSSGGAEPSRTTPSQVPGSQLEKDLAELRDAVTP
jgi:serine/threonine protein kinase